MASGNTNNSFTPYKFKAVKVYSSDEWMAGSTKKYRRVFDRAETTYIRVEFSFFNKWFDEKEWKAKITLKAIKKEGSKREEICSLDTDKTIEIDENVVYIRDGWGNAKPGVFWKKGNYLWEAYIDDKWVGSQEFFVEDVGQVTAKKNPYFNIESIKLFPGGYDWVNEKDRKYLKKFKRDSTPYIWVELKVKNKVNHPWNCEFFYNFYDDAGQLKGQSIVLEYVRAKKNKIYASASGWGNKAPGSWKEDKYTVEIVFMDALIAVVPFEVGDSDVEGVSEVLTTDKLTPIQVEQEKEQSLEELMEELNSLIGLNDIKKKISDHINYLNFIKIRKEKGLDDAESISLHSIFTGNPGTGKTTVVKMLGQIYNKMGLLSQGHVHEVGRTELVGEFIGQTAPRTKKAIEDARGGILFIDEAYMLARKDDSAKDYGHEVIEVLLKEMSDGPGDIAIMGAGYPDEMKTFLDSNPGMKSRFKYYFHFEDYTPGELLLIANYACKKRLVSITPNARDLVAEILEEAYRNRDRSFGNARYAFSIIDESKMNLGLRLMAREDIAKLSPKALSTIEREDVEKIIESRIQRELDLSINDKLLEEALGELNQLVGLSTIKNEVYELVKLVRYYKESGKNVLNKFSLHTVFMGNPGTGKTTVARIIGKIYKALGLLERGHIVECDREALVAGFTGQTAIKSKAKLDEAMGGVLFIDEAYALASGVANDFGMEAIEVILKRMEDSRGEFALIVAGYPDNMNKFLQSNPGLKSRFDRTLSFLDYTPEQLYQIAEYMLSLEDLSPDSEAKEYLQTYFENLFQRRDKYFGNARSVRKVVEQSIRNQHLRMASLAKRSRTKKAMATITFDDVKSFEISEPQNKRLGFRY